MGPPIPGEDINWFEIIYQHITLGLEIHYHNGKHILEEDKDDSDNYTYHPDDYASLHDPKSDADDDSDNVHSNFSSITGLNGE